MCYRKPGPRCAKKIKEEIEKAKNNLSDAISMGKSSRILKVLETEINNKLFLYNITKEARTLLQKDIDENGDPTGSKNPNYLTAKKSIKI